MDSTEKFGGKQRVEISRLTCGPQRGFISKGVFPDMPRPSAHLHPDRMHLAAVRRHTKQAEL